MADFSSVARGPGAYPPYGGYQPHQMHGFQPPLPPLPPPPAASTVNKTETPSSNLPAYSPPSFPSYPPPSCPTTSRPPSYPPPTCPPADPSPSVAGEEPVRVGLAGVKRKGLAHELLGLTATTHHTSWTVLWDTEMPSQLMTRCQPLFCGLCSSPFSSPVQAKMHYEGKGHDKHVRGYFVKLGWSSSMIPQKMDSSGKFPKREEIKCEVCDLEFTSQHCLTQHVMGKNHQKKVSGSLNTKPTIFNKQTKRWENNSKVPESAPQPEISTPFFCEVCKVGAPSQAQLDMHLNGKNHKKKMEKSMGGIKSDDLNAIQKRMQFKEKIMQSMKPKPLSSSEGIFGRKHEMMREKDEYFAFRTPSGCYYCSACNINVNNVAQFVQHIASKKHKQKGVVHKARR